MSAVRPEKIWDRIFTKKPMAVIRAEEANETLPRQLRLFDLLCIGIGGTVGTGIFATAGEIINGTAGPAAAISWMIAGFACCLSGFAYMELSSRVPSSGSCYAYAYYALGELPAVIGASLLTLEYGVSGAGVARSWAAKVQNWAEDLDKGSNYSWLNEDHVNLMGCLIQALSVVVLLAGLRFGKVFINTITVTKVSLVFLMIIAGFSAMETSNLTPFVPARNETTIDGDTEERYGYQGVMLGASSAFFGYVGFDEVCCLAAEAQNPRKIMPLAVIGVVLGTCLLSTLSSLALAGLQDYRDITNGFSGAFGAANLEWAKQIVQAGEVLTMPVVVLVAFLAQPRLQYGLAVDGLLPQVFAITDPSGNLFYNTLLTGILFSIIALVVPFEELWHLVDFGVLMSFNLTNTSLIVSRGKQQVEHLTLATVSFVLVSGAAVFMGQKGYMENDSEIVFAVLTGILAFIAGGICAYLVYLLRDSSPTRIGFTAPFVPVTPCLAIAVNWYLIAQIKNSSLLYGLLWIVGGIVIYFAYGYSHSIGQHTGWQKTLSAGYLRPSMHEVKPSPAHLYTDKETDIQAVYVSNKS